MREPSRLLVPWILLAQGWPMLVAACSPTSAPSGEPTATFVDDAPDWAIVPGTSPSALDDASSRPADTSPSSGREAGSSIDASDDASAAVPEASAEDAPSEAASRAPDNACAAPLGPGQLAIDEIMIESVAGSGDDGEWVEVTNTQACAVDLRGLHAECPRASAVTTLDVADDLWIPPSGSFVIADSTTPAVDHYLPGIVLAWFGHRGDVLRNEGATVTLMANGALVDSVTYPAITHSVGVSRALPSDCPLDAGADWTSWQPSVSSWFPGFYGTPNAPNDDVHCP